jgi:SAM-dependent methyltransferase
MGLTDYTVNSSSTIKRFSHRSRLGRAVLLLDPAPGDRILDYGTGDGALLRFLAEREPRARLAGYEPVHHAEAAMATRTIESVECVCDSLEAIRRFRPNKIACLEVLEHLRPDDLDKALAAFRKALAVDGLVVISVPIEIGPASVFKNITRKVLDQPHRGINPRNVILSLFGMTSRVPRDLEEPYIASHIGFDYRDLERAIRGHGFGLRRHYSPFPALGPLLNSQIFFALNIGHDGL